MCAAVMTGAFVVAAVGAYWLLLGKHVEHARLACASASSPPPSPACCSYSRRATATASWSPSTSRSALAAMEGKFESSARAELALIGQPDVAHERLDNPLVVPGALSFLAYGSFGATVRGLDDFPRRRLARQHRAALLQLPRDGRARHDPHRHHVGGAAIALARPPRARALALVDPDAGVALPLHRDHRRLDDRRARPPAVARLRAHAHRRKARRPTSRAAASPSRRIGWMGLYLVVGVAFLALVARQLARGPADAVEEHY